jgi:hypothetical protein
MRNDSYIHFSQQPHNKLTWLVIFYYFCTKRKEKKRKEIIKYYQPHQLVMELLWEMSVGIISLGGYSTVSHWSIYDSFFRVNALTQLGHGFLNKKKKKPFGMVSLIAHGFSTNLHHRLHMVFSHLLRFWT